MSARKHAFPVNTRIKRWTDTDIVEFRQVLEKIKRPDEPLEERDEFLKLHPVSRTFLQLFKHSNSLIIGV
jgi:hypothetical protein